MLKDQKEALSRSINGGMTMVAEVEQLLKYVAKAEFIDCFDEKLFNRYVEKIIVFSQVEIGFKMKCGVTLKERLVR
ncbi:hypothetical protein QS257_04630 [Terrilactibacillus sp. S3-3]|nr:hypothetical protein QS257_04630 [Terrilactibacillus sp. S3-3]